MPLNPSAIPGTPSIALGRMRPCQWIELVSGSKLVTRSVTVSPSFQRRIGAGNEPLTVVPIRGAPVKFTACSPSVRLKSVPVRVFGPFCLDKAAKALDPKPIPAKALPIAIPCTNRRRVKHTPPFIGSFLSLMRVFFLCRSATRTASLTINQQISWN